MVKIELTQGKWALVDEADDPNLVAIKWCYSGSGYAVHNTSINGKSITILMHRFLMRAKPGEIVDHIDGDPLNNQRANLRIVSYAQNSQNRKASGAVGFLGVEYRALKNKFFASIRKDGKFYSLGYFESPLDAAQAYDNKALELYGPDAATNSRQIRKKIIDSKAE